MVTLFPFIILFLIWMINAYNFVDGIDGMAISGALYISINITIVILFTNKNSDLLSLFLVLIGSLFPFAFLIGLPQVFLWATPAVYF